jgi:hypothetical protein
MTCNAEAIRKRLKMGIGCEPSAPRAMANDDRQAKAHAATG